MSAPTLPLAEHQRAVSPSAKRARPHALPVEGGVPASGALAPTHLADLDLAERRLAVVAAGEPAYRAVQLSRHYFARLVRDPAQLTDIPAQSRARLGASLLPRLLTPV